MSRSNVNHEALAGFINEIFDLETINKRLAVYGLPPVADKNVGALHVAKASGVRNHGEVTVLMLNMANGKVDYTKMTAILKATFPNARVGERHGQHYISQVRTGAVPGLEPGVTVHVLPRGTGKTKAEKQAKLGATTVTVVAPAPIPAVPAAVAPAVDTAALRAELMALSMKEVIARAKTAGLKAIGKKEAIVEALIAIA